MEEIWKDIKGYEGIYQISNLGRIKSLPRLTNKGSGCYISKEMFLKTPKDLYGYPIVGLILNGKRKQFKVHRLIAISFIPNHNNKPEVNHINGIKHDNSLKNLEWCTPKENMRHAVDTGLKVSLKGKKHGMCKLTEKQVLEIKERLKNGERGVSIATAYNTGSSTIYDIKHSRKWKHLY